MAEFKKIDERALAEARKRGETTYAVRATAVRFDARVERLVVTLQQGRAFTLDPKRLPGRGSASRRTLENVSLEGVGATLRFPDLDADFTLSRLIEDFVGADDWMAPKAPAF